MFCISQSLYSLIHVMIEVCYVIVNVIIFKACEKVFTSFSQRYIHRVFPTVRMCMIYEKKRDLLVSTTNNHVYPCEMLPHVIYGYLLCDSLVSSNIKHDSVIHWCIAVSVQVLSKKILSRRKRHALNQLELYQELRT